MTENAEPHQVEPRPPMRLRREVKVAENRFVRVYMDEIEFNNGQSGSHLRIDEPTGGAAVLVKNERGGIYLHKAYHYAGNGFFREIIRGFGETGESAQEVALRELSEEGQFEATLFGEPVCLGHVRPNSTLLTSRIPVFLVTVRVNAMVAARETNEGIHDGKWYSLEEVLELVGSGEIEDAFTLAAMALLQAQHA